MKRLQNRTLLLLYMLRDEWIMYLYILLSFKRVSFRFEYIYELFYTFVDHLVLFILFYVNFWFFREVAISLVSRRESLGIDLTNFDSMRLITRKKFENIIVVTAESTEGEKSPTWVKCSTGKTSKNRGPFVQIWFYGKLSVSSNDTTKKNPGIIIFFVFFYWNNLNFNGGRPCLTIWGRANFFSEKVSYFIAFF
jgi:hypothetical protein